MKATILAIHFLTFTFGILAKELENRQWSGGSAGGSSSALRRQIRKLEYQLEEEQKKNQELTESNEMLKEKNQKCQGGNQHPVAVNTQEPMIPMTFGSTTRNPNIFRPSGPSTPRPSFELIQCQNDLKKEKETNQEIRIQLEEYKEKTKECQAKVSTKEPVDTTTAPVEPLNEGHHECKEDLDMAERNIHELQGKLEKEDQKNRALIAVLRRAGNETATVKAKLERCLEKHQDDENDNGELHRCQQDLSMKNDTIEQMKHLEKDLEKAREKIKELQSESGESNDELKSVDSLKKGIQALIESRYKECKEEFGDRQCWYQHNRRRRWRWSCDYGKSWMSKRLQSNLGKPLCEDKEPNIVAYRHSGRPGRRGFRGRRGHGVTP